jgi:hypothetical protein
MVQSMVQSKLTAVLESKGSCRYIVALFLAHKEAELSWNRSYLAYIERYVNVSVKLDYNIKVSAS